MERVDREKWLERMMEQWEESLLRTCFAYLNDLALAEDAVQETFLKAWKGYDSFRGAAQEKTWLMRIAINTCRDVRRSAYIRHIDRKTSLDELPEGSCPFEMKDDTLIRAVMGLPLRLREPVLLCWYQELTAEETAQALRVSRSTVYSRLEKAKKLLRRELEAWYYEEG